MVFNTEPYTVLPDNFILNTANMQSEMGFPSSHQLKSYIASKSRLKLAAHAVLSADAGLLVTTRCSAEAFYLPHLPTVTQTTSMRGCESSVNVVMVSRMQSMQMLASHQLYC